MKTTNTIIIGASAAGLACAASLTKRSMPYLLLEQHAHIAYPWRNHYDRLHLNTHKKQSGLPYLPFPDEAPAFVPRDEVVAYMERYAVAFGIHPVFNAKVTSVQQEGGKWMVSTTTEQYLANHIIMATGNNRQPFRPVWPGMEDFQGTVLHSAEYKNGAPYHGRQVLVIGFGNSACEISICLHEHGAFPALAVKGPVNIVPRGNGGDAVSNFFDRLAWITKLAPALIDAINAPALRKQFGDSEQYGLKKLPYGPNVQIMKHKQVPLLDIGTYDLIRKGSIKVYPGVARFTPAGVRFTDGQEASFDVVILGTGYRSALSDMLPDAGKVTDPNGRPLVSGAESALEGLFFCGFSPSPLGMLKEIGLEAKKIASLIYKKGVAGKTVS